MAQCISPFTKKDNKNGMATFPCGVCVNCLKRRASGWSFRLTRHWRDQQRSLFVTLTYDTSSVPITNRGFKTLHKKHPTDFFKRLRDYASRNPEYKHLKISYYLCGEYGKKGVRPHYHAIIFNADHRDIEKAWRFGSIHIGNVTEASIGYTLKYMYKERIIPVHRNDDRVPEFSRMSKGIGKNYLTEAMKNYHLTDYRNRMFITLPGGNKIAMPRYYKDKLYTDYQREQIGKHLAALHDGETIDWTRQDYINEFNRKSEEIRRFEKDKRLNEKL